MNMSLSCSENNHRDTQQPEFLPSTGSEVLGISRSQPPAELMIEETHRQIRQLLAARGAAIPEDMELSVMLV